MYHCNYGFGLNCLVRLPAFSSCLPRGLKSHGLLGRTAICVAITHLASMDQCHLMHCCQVILRSSFSRYRRDGIYAVCQETEIYTVELRLLTQP